MFRAVMNLSGLLVLVVYVCSNPAPTHHKSSHYQHRTEIIKSVDELLKAKKDILKELVPFVKMEECEAKHLCQLQLVLETINHKEFGKNGTINRALTQYNKQFEKTCSMPNRDEEVELTHILMKLQNCMRRINSQT